MLTLIIGGARSGKSDLALRLARASARDVLFVATMEPRDDETRARIEQHRTERPAHWRTLEAPLHLEQAARDQARPGEFVVVDCLTLWVSNLMLDGLPATETIDPGDARRIVEAVRDESAALAGWATAFDGDVAIVTNEVGSGVVPAYAQGRLFRDALGIVNATVARRAGRVYSMVAGLALELKSLGAAPADSFGDGGSR